MKKFLLHLTLLFIAVIFVTPVISQDWVSKMKDPNVNFFEVQKSFNKYYVKKNREIERMKRKATKQRGEAVSDEEIEVPGYSQYKRWEWFMAPRVSPSGDRFDPSTAWREYHNYRDQYKVLNAGNWTLIGPSGNIPSSGGGAGRVNFVRFDPTNNNTIYCGSPGGGLWKSTTGGTTWSTNTDQLSQVIGCTDIAIDPTNTNVMYLATGDGDAGDTYSVGLLKTTDGGQTWNPTGLSFFTANFRQISKVLVNPTNTNIILVATSAGIYRSSDAGGTFTNVQTSSFKDMEFKPGDPNIVYASGTEFYRSIDAGATWNKITANLPAAAALSRMAIAVTEDDANYVYLLTAVAASDYGFEGLYLSTNSGANFSSVNVTYPSNLLGWDSGGGDNGGQGWYDLGFAASPTNKDEIIVGGVNIWRSTNGGSSFTLNGHWTGTGAPYVHADVHDLIYINGSSYFAGCDGGLFKTQISGANWTDLSNGLQIAEMYGFGQSSINPNLFIQGWQDNGTNRYNGTNWTQVMGGDGMLAFIDWNNDQNMWGEQYNGALNRSTNGGNSFTSSQNGIFETGAWVTPWSQDPVTSSTIYAGFINLWKSSNGGVAWSKISNFSGNATVTTFAVSPANNQVIWLAKPGVLYKTSNGGGSWTTITGIPSGTITGITCSNTDANKAWICYSGFANTNKVFQTVDQGQNWTNLSSSIPNIPVNCITYLNNSNDGLYIGTDVGVFFKDASLNIWQPFFNGLPNVIVTQLSIFYPSSKIRASTYGRGLWESDLYVPGTYPPTAAFGSDIRIACPGAAIQFTDFSAGQPTSWNWTFISGFPATSTAQNPVVCYNLPGTYPVTLTATNANGTDSKTYTSYVTISATPYGDPATVGATRCGPGSVTLSATGSGTGTLRWWDAPGGGNMLSTGNSYSPNITNTTAYFVDEDFPLGSVDYTGEFSYGAGAFFSANDIRGLYFDVLQPVILNTVDVFPNSAGDRTIEVLDNQGNTVIDTTIYMPATGTNPHTVNLNFTLYPGTNYFIKCRGFVDLYRNTSGGNYPYTSSGINVTGSNAGLPGYYYFFYNWVYTQFSCNTGRAICWAVDSCAVQGIDQLSDNSMFQIYPNPNSGAFDLKFNSQAAGDFDVQIVNTLGQVIFREKIASFSGDYVKKIDLGKNTTGVYLLRVSNSGKEMVKKLVVY